MRRILVLVTVFTVLSGAAFAINTAVGPTFGMRIGELDYFGPVFGFKGDIIFPQAPFNGMFAISPAMEFSIEDIKVFNINFAGKFRYPTGDFVPQAYMGFAFFHMFGDYSDNEGEFLLGGGAEYKFSPKMFFGLQIETFTFDAVDLEGFANFYL